MRVLSRAALYAVALGAVACGSDSPTAPAGPPPTTLPARSAITITFEPDPVIASASLDPQFPFAYAYTMIIRETAGLPCNLNRWDETLINPVTNLQAPPRTYGVADAQRLAGTNFIAAMGTLRIPRTNTYNPGGTAGSGRQVNYRTAVQVIDANGNTINADNTIRILGARGAVPIE